ncbi:hypothetical protein CMQ_5107 [Grosmannia clavigera kw1407]|uniref:Alpha beta hydrolase fold family n=1 Tax=Grosmannia clavigera (strain kw1407 / UAMH 11150) TaxID=655863 RepID=F0XBW0_GROCL|nr:uncharacterized protein CMQ_5107 [Grosmannia clavigera kw1407]EFX04845.1 hypothetical protein CMQ_5107 [Grosmannia clavigera kw1407]
MEEQGLVYAGEHITWEHCGDLDGRPLECSTIHVPMDQFDASNSGGKTFSIPLIRQRGRGISGDARADLPNLLLNPGGPGGSGINFMYRRGALLRAVVGEGVHLLSFDPRGVNGSRPRASCYPDVETRRQRAIVRSSRVIEDSTEAYAWSYNYVRACADTMGEHGLYLNTPQTAADMNSILDAVGQDAMVYWGFSYGTLLGQTYATLFPERAQRVIIDGVANQFDWYEGLLDAEVFADTENVWDGFLDECVKAGKERCALVALIAASPAHQATGGKEILRERLAALGTQLQASPSSIYVNNTVYGALSYETIWYKAIFMALYKPATWHALADALAKMIEGNATAALLAYGLDEPWGETGDDLVNFVTYNDGASGASYWQQDRQWLLELLVPYMNESVFTPSEYGGYYIKQQWHIPRTHSYVPRTGVQTAHPLLLLSTTFDPVCPLVSARSAQAAFEGSQIVEVLGYGHCSVAMPSMCLARHVRAFLYNGTLPDTYTQCEVDGPYFVRPEASGKVVAQRHFDDPTESSIHLAQLELARDWVWR